MSEMTFEAAAQQIGTRLVVRLPQPISDQLPSRSMNMAEGTLNGHAFTLPLEPDGQGGHWLEVGAELAAAAGVLAGTVCTLALRPAEQWPEPQMPEDILQGIGEAGLTDVWDSLTTKARWEWLRWIRSTNSTATREKRILVGVDKLRKGMRRPCCFNTAGCTVPDVSKSGVLKDS